MELIVESEEKVTFRTVLSEFSVAHFPSPPEAYDWLLASSGGSQRDGSLPLQRQ